MDDYNQYPKQRVKIFLKYLIHAAKRHKLVNIERKTTRQILSEKEMKERSNFLDQRAMNLTDERITELEAKINIHYTQNKYLPYEERLKKLRKRFYSMKRKKDTSKTKINEIKSKIKKCEFVLKKMKKSDLNVL